MVVIFVNNDAITEAMIPIIGLALQEGVCSACGNRKQKCESTQKGDHSLVQFHFMIKHN